jgi:hypothetical protein
MTTETQTQRPTTLDPNTQDLEPQPNFCIQDRASLEWLVRTVNAKQQEITTINVQAAAMVKDLNRELDQLEFLYGAQARALVQQLLEGQRGKARHIKTLWGNVGFSASSQRIEINNKNKTLEWAQHHAPEVLKTEVNYLLLTSRFTVSPDGSSLVDKTDGSRLEIPGLGIKPSKQRFYIRAVNGTGQPEDITQTLE